MRSLVTGGAGFIGSTLAEELLARGDDVVVLDDFSTGTRENLAGCMHNPRFTLIEGSITDRETCSRACGGIDRIFHHAAVTSVLHSIEDPERTTTVNVNGMVILLLAARNAGVKRIIFASSTAVYGNPDRQPVVETMPIAPLSPYAASKAAGEQYACAFGEVYGMTIVGLRYFNVYGPRQDPCSPYAAVIPLFIRALLNGDRPTIYGDGSQTRDFVYVGDVVTANIRAAETPLDGGRVFNVGTGRRVSILDLYRHIADLACVSGDPDFAPARPGEVRHSVADITTARQDLGFTAAVDIKEGLTRTIAWFSRQGSTACR